MNCQIRSPLWIAHTQHDYAHMLVLRNQTGGNDKALELPERALLTAQQLGVTALGNKARALKLAAEGAARPPALPEPA